MISVPIKGIFMDHLNTCTDTDKRINESIFKECLQTLLHALNAYRSYGKLKNLCRKAIKKE